jgi:uncharacterized membrane protein
MGRTDTETTTRPPQNPQLADIVERNICTLLEVRRQSERTASWQDRTADSITRFVGSMTFVYFHAVWFAAWILMNTRVLPIPPFDPYPFGLLTMIVSLEAIFLSTFILVSQNRMQTQAEKRADLDLQINLLSEHEVTRLIKLVDAIADHLGVQAGRDPEVEELKKDIAPEVVLKEMEAREQEIIAGIEVDTACAEDEREFVAAGANGR